MGEAILENIAAFDLAIADTSCLVSCETLRVGIIGYK